MCVHFTALVDAHIPRIAACIRDPCELVRRQVCGSLETRPEALQRQRAFHSTEVLNLLPVDNQCLFFFVFFTVFETRESAAVLILAGPKTNINQKS